MAQFDVWEFGPKGAVGPLVVDVQNAMFDALAARLVVPLYPARASNKLIQRLNPVVEIDGQNYYLAVQEMAAVRANALVKKVNSLVVHRDQIIAAIDFLTTGI
jgi:toxin CcdB